MRELDTRSVSTRKFHKHEEYFSRSLDNIGIGRGKH
jgi:hypothetical protein